MCGTIIGVGFVLYRTRETLLLITHGAGCYKVPITAPVGIGVVIGLTML